MTTDNLKLKTNNSKLRDRDSFTLVELLIVIGILAILTAAVVITLNPAERLRESRDSQRIQELSSLEQTINLLLTQTPNLSMGTASTVYISIPDSSATCANLGLPTLPTGYTYACKTAANYRKTDGTGWIPLNFQSGLVASLPTLPVDPTNATSTGLYYTYMMGGSFELNAGFESGKYKLGGSNDRASTDAGNAPGLLEKGTSKYLVPVDYGDSQLVAYWTFNEGSGTVVQELSGKGNPFNWSGVQQHWGQGINSYGGLYYSGGTDYLRSSHIQSQVFGTGDFTISFWIKIPFTNTPATGYWPRILSKGGSSSAGAHAWAFLQVPNVTNSVNFAMSSNAGGSFEASMSVGPLASGWHYLSVVRAGSMCKLYLDGLYAVQDTTCSTDLSDTSDMIIGSDTYSGTTIDEIRLYKRALSDSAIYALYSMDK